MLKKLLAVILAILMISALAIPSFAKEAENEEDPLSYPFILVHGMMGWGDDPDGLINTPYFADGENGFMSDYMEELGLEVYAPTIGPLSSAWDRACELYAQLMGTVVDYGAAHSAKYGHERYGRDYTGRALMSEPWNMTDKLNFIGHSFGGPTLTVFSSLLAFGDEEEQEAAGETCSPLFEGGHAEGIYSIISLAGVHNGTPLCNILYKIPGLIPLACGLINIVGTSKKPILDFMLDQFGVTADPAKGEKAKLNLKGIKQLASCNDNNIYDMTIEANEEFNKKYNKTIDSVYYFSYNGDITEELFGDYRIATGGKGITKALCLTASLIFANTDKDFGGTYLDNSWKRSDGMVPVPSATHPRYQAYTDYDSSKEIETGVWNVMPTVDGATHSWFTGLDSGDLRWFYDDIFELIASTAKEDT